MCVLALLDFSSAFDTIDHSILVHRLYTDFGFTDTVLQWFSYYLTDRTHYISLSKHCSAFALVHSGVPHIKKRSTPLSFINVDILQRLQAITLPFTDCALNETTMNECKFRFFLFTPQLEQ